MAGFITISGSLGAAGAGATVVLSGAHSASTTAAAITGNYSFTVNLPAVGTYVVTPQKTGSAFSPPFRTVIVVATESHPGVNFSLYTPQHSIGNCTSNPGFAPTISSAETSQVDTGAGTETNQ